ncbi:type II toxin-antitoxin system HicB family antitoxin [Candidatus Synechococcus calcipolaris G9]|uniref:Type II toxin-antitoxin system HicB family antitoxin n=1 Tax=Candidatus Synechococcus calcipolaris G9 TaxID=1497997 RepID=A0ABT6F130_9SYNE|nr:type II toxin-antitoxin system HicB family antitoxin [Candidatus Synechococcus calcipolaris]MDG2991557.1 type II toxin-antitoxin system HicB family antitoxin [Candidatus Synechococcus calcipolaris G9]
MKTLRDYTIVLQPENNGTFVAYVPAIDGCHAWGETPEAAQQELVKVFEMIREERLNAGEAMGNSRLNHKCRDDARPDPL